MPRKARIEALHHVICRGIERRKIFDNDSDLDNFMERLGTILRWGRNEFAAMAKYYCHFRENHPPTFCDTL